MIILLLVWVCFLCFVMILCWCWACDLCLFVDNSGLGMGIGLMFACCDGLCLRCFLHVCFTFAVLIMTGC